VSILVVTAVKAEADAVGAFDDVRVVAAGVGRTNAAVATTLNIERHGPFDAVISTGLAGVLPGSDLQIGDVLAAECCVYAEEGIDTPEGFQDMAALGFPLGDFEGNAVPCDAGLLRALRDTVPIHRIATVATCSGTDESSERIALRTGCVAEAMEGAAVVHAARIHRIPAIEVRVISNTTGQRDRQVWDRPGALAVLRSIMPGILARFEAHKPA
jgi:futalosine hydrolase